jgi:hypothetical protein
MKSCLDKTIAKIPACDQVTKLSELAELAILYNTLAVITRLTFQHAESRAGISAVGGGESVIKMMKTFPRCQRLQEGACAALRNLTLSSTGRTNAIESDGIEVILAAVSNHLGSATMCKKACLALVNIVNRSTENTELLITLGGGVVGAKVRSKWRNNDQVQPRVRQLAMLIVGEMKAWADEE